MDKSKVDKILKERKMKTHPLAILHRLPRWITRIPAKMYYNDGVRYGPYSDVQK
jgi:hypothetical protein